MTTTSVNSLPVVPLPDGVIFPDMVVTVSVGSREATRALDEAVDGRVLLVPQTSGRFAQVGVIAVIVDDDRDMSPDEQRVVTIRAEARARIGAGHTSLGDVLWVNAEPIPEATPTPELTAQAEQYRAAATALLERIGGRRLASALRPVSEMDALADSVAYWPELSQERRVQLLETVDLSERFALATEWVREALAEYEIKEKITRDVSEELSKGQREAILRRQLAAIKSELGELDGTDENSYAERLEALRAHAEHPIPEGVDKAIQKEIDRLERMGSESMESSWIRTWLDTVLDMPWNQYNEERLNLGEAREILDADHTGLEDVKDRLIEHLAVRKLRADRGVQQGERRGAILALVGPPGVGKTSLGESIAQALGRSFVRLALGGLRDEAEIRGHRRTYVGARPGRVVRALLEAGSMNPVIMLDEIDKVSGGWQGDPSAALLEVLDPAQNHSFRDNYFEFELDLSDVFFIATANVLDSIPGPLLDRLEVIVVDGYTDFEKTEIATQHLLPKLTVRNGLQPGEVVITPEAVATIAADYTREAGVRRLERMLDKALRRAAKDIATADETPVSDPADGDPAGGTTNSVPDASDPSVAEEGGESLEARVTIDVENLLDMLGKPIPREETQDRIDRPGIATGLAVTGAGGDVLFVETALIDGEGEAVLTGQLGDVMKESATIVRSLVSSQAERLGVSLPAGKRIHVHFPAGAIPKDGPSAGVTMTTALVSLLSGRKVRSDVAMTGEVALGGKVLPIGGVKQKVLAAHRAGITTVLLPEANGRDVDDIPEDVRNEVEIHLVSDVSQALDLALEPAAA
ncbi:MAG: endopeptidase La [Acidimicrobiia bacterium]|nr:endopeptidase La [Acidimicrobiia bacterium]MBP8181686.1 endopeptidase La [Acidimicrobiia bacterium]